MTSDTDRIAQLKQLILKDHPRVPDTRCGVRFNSEAYWSEKAHGRPPGPPAPPDFCVLTEGHGGKHRSNLGGTVREPHMIKERHNGRCVKCQSLWPCPVVQEMETILGPDA